MRRTLAIVLLTTAALFVAPVAAWSAVTRDPRGDMRAPGLTAAERKAMDIIRVRSMYDGAGLLMVDLRVAGNINGLMGRGHLRRALAGIQIRPHGGRSTAIVTGGRRSNPQGGKRGPAEALLVDRNRSQIRFIATGVKQRFRIIAATVARPRDRGARAAQEEELSPELKMAQFFVDSLTPDLRRQVDRETDEEFARNFRLSCRPANYMEQQLAAEERELREKAAQADEARRAKIEAVIERLLRAGARVRAKAQSCAGSGGLPEDFKASWAHGAGRSRICVYVTGRAGQTGDVTVNGTAEPTPVKTFTLDSSGRATVSYDISVPGTYPVSVRWSQEDGTSATRNGAVAVTGGQPPPGSTPAGFADCPAPPPATP